VVANPIYTITFNTNGGTAVATSSVISGNLITPPTPPEKTNVYESKFAGWYKEAALTTPWNFATDTVTANITLHAKWEAYAIGDTGPGGGKIFYVLVAGFTMTDTSTTAHYLEAATADVPGSPLAWATSTADIAGTVDTIGAGRKNTALILAADAGAPAALACKNYNGGGKTDWFLPSLNELKELHTNRTLSGLAGTFVTTSTGTDDYYWSSSQYADAALDKSSSVSFVSGIQGIADKTNTHPVRAIRAF
jgi:uncharacterized repeat protein (TIGR02543 family)